MYVYDQAATRSVEGTLTESDGLIAAQLSYVNPPVSGPKNTIIVDFTSPVSDTGTVTNAVFQAAGH